MLFCFVFLNNNSFIEILFMYLTVYPLPVYKSVAFSIFTELYDHYHSQAGRFSSPSKKKCRSHRQSLSPSSSPSVPVSFCPESGSAFRKIPQGAVVAGHDSAPNSRSRSSAVAPGADVNVVPLPWLPDSQADWELLGP